MHFAIEEQFFELVELKRFQTLSPMFYQMACLIFAKL